MAAPGWHLPTRKPELWIILPPPVGVKDTMNFRDTDGARGLRGGQRPPWSPVSSSSTGGPERDASFRQTNAVGKKSASPRCTSRHADRHQGGGRLPATSVGATSGQGVREGGGVTGLRRVREVFTESACEHGPVRCARTGDTEWAPGQGSLLAHSPAPPRGTAVSSGVGCGGRGPAGGLRDVAPRMRVLTASSLGKAV